MLCCLFVFPFPVLTVLVQPLWCPYLLLAGVNCELFEASRDHPAPGSPSLPSCRWPTHVLLLQLPHIIFLPGIKTCITHHAQDSPITAAKFGELSFWHSNVLWPFPTVVHKLWFNYWWISWQCPNHLPTCCKSDVTNTHLSTTFHGIMICSYKVSQYLTNILQFMFHASEHNFWGRMAFFLIPTQCQGFIHTIFTVWVPSLFTTAVSTWFCLDYVACCCYWDQWLTVQVRW